MQKVLDHRDDQLTFLSLRSVNEIKKCVTQYLYTECYNIYSPFRKSMHHFNLSDNFDKINRLIFYTVFTNKFVKVATLIPNKYVYAHFHLPPQPQNSLKLN